MKRILARITPYHCFVVVMAFLAPALVFSVVTFVEVALQPVQIHWEVK